MTELLNVVTGVSTFVKVGWACWLVWAGLQFAWYRAVRDLPDSPEPVADELSTGWHPVAQTRHTTLLGAPYAWSPTPASEPVMEASDLPTNDSPDTPIGSMTAMNTATAVVQMSDEPYDPKMWANDDDQEGIGGYHGQGR